MSNIRFSTIKKIVIPCAILAGLAACKDGRFVQVPAGDGFNPFGTGSVGGSGEMFISGVDLYKYDGTCTTLVDSVNMTFLMAEGGLPTVYSGTNTCVLTYAAYDSTPDCTGPSTYSAVVRLDPNEIFVLPIFGSPIESINMLLECT